MTVLINCLLVICVFVTVYDFSLIMYEIDLPEQITL